MLDILKKTMDEDIGYRLDDIEADHILFVLEKMGMKPPAYLKPIPFESDGKQYPLVPGDIKNNDGVWCTPGQFGWEDEEK